MRVAVHEAAHAVAALVMGLPVTRATVIPKGDTLGCVFHGRRLWDLDRTSAVVMLLAGAEAERRYARGRGTCLILDYDGSDKEIAYPMIHTLYLGALSDSEFREALMMFRQQAASLVEREWAWIERTAHMLEFAGELNVTEILELR